jgi:transcriptional regulator with XRE-family HTH domain
VADKHSLMIDTPGRRIRYLRRAKDLTQAALATELDVSQPTVAKWERDKRTPSPAQQVRLAEALGVSRLFFQFDEELVA